MLSAKDGEFVDPLRCHANCHPSCNYTWSKAGGTTAIAVTNHTEYLELGAVSKDSAGAYTCTVFGENGHIGTVNLVVDILCKLICQR